MAEAKQGSMVKVHYTGKFDDDKVFDSSAGREPLEFKLGEGQIIPGFEQAVEGMNPGESKTITIPADEAFGPHREELEVRVEREQFPQEVEPKVGEHLQIAQPDGESVVVTITDLDDNTVTLDANHPLAGKDLTFDIEVLEVGG